MFAGSTGWYTSRGGGTLHLSKRSALIPALCRPSCRYEFLGDRQDTCHIYTTKDTVNIYLCTGLFKMIKIGHMFVAFFLFCKVAPINFYHLVITRMFCLKFSVHELSIVYVRLVISQRSISTVREISGATIPLTTVEFNKISLTHSIHTQSFKCNFAAMLRHVPFGLQVDLPISATAKQPLIKCQPSGTHGTYNF